MLLAEVFGEDDFVVVAEILWKGEIEFEQVGEGWGLVDGVDDGLGIEVLRFGVEVADAQGIGGGVEGFDVFGDIELDAGAGPVFDEGCACEFLDGAGVGAVQNHGFVSLLKKDDEAFFGLAVGRLHLLCFGAQDGEDEVFFFGQAVGAEEVVVELFFPVGFHGG